MNDRLQVFYLEIKRRLSRLLGDDRWIWPSSPEGLSLSPSHADFAQYERAPLRLSWKNNSGHMDPLSWQKEVRQRLQNLLGLDGEHSVEAEVLHDVQLKGLKSGLCGQTVYLQSGSERQVPVTLLWDAHESMQARPIMLCLQGHTSGAHISWGQPRLPIDVSRIANGGDFGRQAVDKGYIAVCIEQACFGERRETAVSQRWDHSCIDAVTRSLLIGKTLLGNRVADVCAVLDWLEGGVVPGPGMDTSRIHAMGNSAGGETALFVMAMDPRISAVIAGSCVGSYRQVIGRRRGCPDTVIPGILQWLEYEDVLGLCAPRPLLAVSGETDHIYPYKMARECVEAARDVYSAMNAPGMLRCESGTGGHQFYPDIAWPAFLELTGMTT